MVYYLSMKVATIGDPHGCIEEFTRLYKQLEWMSLDQIWVLGDLVDRGPDSGAVVRLCREKRINCVLGNHEEAIINLWARRVSDPTFVTQNKDKQNTLNQLTQEDVDFLKSLPRLHVIDQIGLVLVHGGVWPGLAWHEQPPNVVRAQMVNPSVPGQNRWWGPDAKMSGKKAKSEEESRKEGWSRWYEVYDHEYDVVYGHSVFSQPYIHRNPGCGRTVGVDTASCFGGSITAGIFTGSGDPFFVSVKATKVHYDLTRRLVNVEYEGRP